MTSPPVTDRKSGNERAYVLKAAAVMAVLIVLAGLIAWAMWRRGKWFRGENGAAWQYQPAKAADAGHPKPAMPDNDAAALPPPGALPDTSAAATPNLPSTPLRKPSPAIGMPLARPVRQQPEAAVAVPHRRKRHHRDFLGLGKLWHWIRRDHHKPQE
jgi:hypothetical protein